MALTTRRSGKSPLTTEQEQLEQRMRNVEDFMARISGMMETLTQNQSQSPLLMDAEQADILRARLRANQERSAAELAGEAANTTRNERESGVTKLITIVKGIYY